MENIKTNTQKPTILIVDDMASNIVLLSELLKDDYNLKIANNGEKALEIANETQKPDLIIFNIEVPGIDGYEVCKKLKENVSTSGIPVIFITARNNIEDEEYALNLGAVDYISKPFHPNILKIRIRNHINLKLNSDFLESISMIDGLTQIYNRRYFDEEFKKACRQMAREDKNVALIMIDIDCFKLYNDNYGHGKGDECLIKIATALKSKVRRASDMVARYGGEEFIVILKDIDKEGIECVAENLLNAVRDLNILHEHYILNYVTISLGVAYLNAKDIESQLDFLKMADDAMYKAKENGRNRIEIWEC